MADERSQQSNQNPWLHTPEPVRRTRTQRMEEHYAGQYTPNEPDGNEAVYAARAAAARQRAQALRTEAITQMAIAQDEPDDGTAGEPDAVLYRHSTGIPAAAPGEPSQRRRRRRADAYRAEEEASHYVISSGNVSGIADGEEALTDTARTRAQAIQAAREALDKQESTLKDKAEAAKAEARAGLTADLRAPETQKEHKPGKNQREKTATAKEKLGFFNRRSSAPAPSDDTLLLVNTTTTPFGLPEGVEWQPPKAAAAPAEDDDDASMEDRMDSTRMPTPAPVSTLDVPKAKKTNRLLTLLAVLMLLVAAGGFLWLSGLGESLWKSASSLYTELTTETIKTGEMSVVPEAAAVPTTLTVTLATDNTIADLRLLDDDGNVMPASIICTANGEDCLWSCRVVIETPYSGFIRAQLLDKNGQWILGSSSRYVSIN